MAPETPLWDSAELLETPEEIAAYIEAAFEDGGPSVITHALGASSAAPRGCRSSRGNAASHVKRFIRR
jgi:DNA-binding phage protein